MLERGHAEPQLHLQALRAAVVQIPLLVHLPELSPGAAVLLPGPSEARSGHEFGVGAPLPFTFGQALVPERLRLRACKHVAAEALEFLSGPAVEQFVVLPIFSGIFYHVGPEVCQRQN